MNISQAKHEIVRTFRAYTRRNPDGTHCIPLQQQRPLLLIGPPGIGKTAIVRQIAQENDIGLVAYAMTHHTRQSAIGLPFISQKEYGGRMYSVTEYTMSEIVAAVYDYMRETGKQSGILFLDEINCVSETLTPVMLQLLQNKTFGNVPLPEDWIIVAAGNPPEYNKSVREFDMVTLDRVKVIDVEADLTIWQRYALAQGVHPAVRTYLSVYPDHFYRITDTDRGQFFVTARGWEDLSLMLSAYEEEGISVDANWFLQYIQYDEIARSFGLYYDLFRHFAQSPGFGAGDFSLGECLLRDAAGLAGRSSAECLALAAMLFHPVKIGADALSEEKKRTARLRELASLLPADDAACRGLLDQKREALAVKLSHGIVKPEEEYREKAALARLEEDLAAWRRSPEPAAEGFSRFEAARFREAESACAAQARALAERIAQAYRVLESCPRGRSAALYLTSDLAASPSCAEVLADHPCAAYAGYAREMEIETTV